MANKSKLMDDIAESQWELKEQARKLLEGRKNARGECAIVFNVRLIGRAKNLRAFWSQSMGGLTQKALNPSYFRQSSESYVSDLNIGES